MACLANKDFTFKLSKGVKFSRKKGELFGFHKATHRGKLLAENYYWLHSK